jgi:hypothetical protein
MDALIILASIGLIVLCSLKTMEGISSSLRKR